MEHHINFITLKPSKINNRLKLICSTKEPHVETAINICRSLTNGIIQPCTTLYEWVSKEISTKLMYNKCYSNRLASINTFRSFKCEADFSEFLSLVEEYAEKCFQKIGEQRW